MYFILESISVQSFHVVPLLLNDRVPTFRKICYSIWVPLLFSPRMVRVPAAETYSREGKWCPRMGYSNLWNKSKSGGLVSGLHGAWGNTSHSYLLSKSVTTFPRCGHVLCGPSPSKSGRVLCITSTFSPNIGKYLLSFLFCNRSTFIFCPILM